MGDSEFSMDIYKFVKISIRTVMKNSEIEKSVPDHLKTKRMCKDAVKKLHFLIRYIPSQCKTQQMCDKAILENCGTLKSVSDCCKNQEVCNKAVDNYRHALEFALPECYAIRLEKCVIKLLILQFVPKCYKTQEMCYKAANGCLLYLIIFPINVKLKKYVNSCFFISFLIVYCPDRFKTQKMCDEAVNDDLSPLEFIPDWFVTSRMIKKLFTTLYADDGLLCFNEDSDNVTFSISEMGILSINLNNINLDNNFDEDNPDTIILATFLAWYSKFKKNVKHLKEK